MEIGEYNDLTLNYINGNISVFKEELNRLTKKQLLEFIEFAQQEFDLNAIPVCKRYLE